MLAGISDSRLVRGVLAGREDAFAVIVRRHTTAVYAVAFAHVTNHAEAEDIVQETFLKAYKSLRELREPKQLRPWLTTIARNTARTALKRKGRELEAAKEEVELDIAVNPAVESRERRELVQRLVERLDEHQREVVLLHYFAGLSVRNVAHSVNATPDAVKKRLQRAREALGRELLRDLGPADDVKALRGRVLGALGVPAVTSSKTVAALALGALAKPVLIAASIVVVAAVINVTVGDNERKANNTAIAQTANVSTVSDEGSPASADAADEELDQPVESNLDDDLVMESEDHEPEAGNGTAPETSNSYELRGQVLDSAQNPLAGAHVLWWFENSGSAHGTRTDDDGHFVLDEDELAPQKAIYIEARADGWSAPAHGPVVLSTDERVIETTLILQPAATLSGQVVDQFGEPLEGVRVNARTPIVHWHNHESETIGDGGAFTIDTLFAGRYTLGLVFEDPYAYSSLPDTGVINVSAGESLDDLVLVYPRPEENARMFGVVTDTEGLPLAGAKVELENTGRSVETNEDGYFEIDDVTDISHSLKVSRDGYAVRSVMSATPSDSPHTFELYAERTMRGRVVAAETGDPINEFEYYLINGIVTTWPYAFHLEQNSLPGGRFTATTTVSDASRLYVRAEGYAPFTSLLSELSSAPYDTEIVIALQAGRKVSGRVLSPNGEPLAGARVFAGVPLNRLSYALDMLPATGSDGRYELDFVLSDAETVTAAHGDYAATSIPLPMSSQPIELDVQLTEGGVVEGVVYLDGEPYPGAEVQITGLGKTANSDDEGRFRFGGISPGEVEVNATFHTIHIGDPNRQVGRTYRGAAAVAEGQATQFNCYFKTGGAPVHCQVLFNGAPVADAVVTHLQLVLERENEGPGLDRFYAQANKDGDVHYPALPAGEYRVSAFATGDFDGGNKTITTVTVPPEGLADLVIDIGEAYR